MAKRAQRLATMSVDALLALRKKIDTVLNQKTAKMRKQLEQLDVGGGKLSVRKAAGGRSGRGRKVAPKYRDPDDPSNVWAGRGVVPRWMTAKIKAGATRDDFLIDSSGSRKTRVAKL